MSLLSLLLLLGSLLGGAAFLLRVADRRFRPRSEPLIDAINAELPQTQCAQCGYAGCRPYAEAIVRDDAPLNLCPPGGPQTEAALYARLGRTAPRTSRLTTPPPQLAIIDEAACIGCAWCLPACPVDAIIGANGFMHTVLAAECTGCELCIAPCPVDCISLVANPAGAR